MTELEIIFQFDEGLYKLYDFVHHLDHSLTPFFQNHYFNCEK
jgi:hypothetical protein